MAKLAGEVPAGELEAYRRAGGPVLELMDEVERRRLECGIDGLDPWTVPAATRAAFLCAWNAFVLQTVANDLVDADYALDPQTPGHLPAATAEQALRLYRQVEGWVSRARQAQANPDYRLEVPVPAPLPPWHRTRPVPPAHVHSLVHAMRSVREHAGAAMAFLPDSPPADAEKQAQFHRIRQLHASAQVSARYADEMAPRAASGVNDRAAEHARSAIEQFYLLGQLIADPALAKESVAAAPGNAGPVPPSPGPAPRLLGGWPVGAGPAPQAPAQPATAEPSGRELAKQLVTRHDDHTGEKITEAPVAVDFAGRLQHEARFELRPTLVRGREGETAVLRVAARGESGFTRLVQGTLTLHVDGQEVVLWPWPGAQSRMSTLDGRALYEEDVGFPLPRGMLEGIAGARRTWLRMDTGHGALQPDGETMARLQACCRDFLRAVAARDPDPHRPRPRRG